MPLSVWFGVKFTPGGHSTFFGFLNTFVHIIMYSYYLIAALGPQYQKYLWWKKYLTTIQMVPIAKSFKLFFAMYFLLQIQFVLVMVHAFQLLFVDCNYPKAFVWWIGMHAVMFYFLFSNFYKQTYIGHKKSAQKVKNNDNNKQTRKAPIGICFPTQTALYEKADNIKDMSKGYTSEGSKLRNRVFIDTPLAN